MPCVVLMQCFFSLLQSTRWTWCWVLIPVTCKQRKPTGGSLCLCWRACCWSTPRTGLFPPASSITLSSRWLICWTTHTVTSKAATTILTQNVLACTFLFVFCFAVLFCSNYQCTKGWRKYLLLKVVWTPVIKCSSSPRLNSFWSPPVCSHLSASWTCATAGPPMQFTMLWIRTPFISQDRPYPPLPPLASLWATATYQSTLRWDTKASRMFATSTFSVSF